MRKYYLATFLIGLFTLASYGLYHEVTKSSFADQTAMDDIGQLQEKINSYVEKNKHLPASLNDLQLSQQKVATRLNNYTYTQQGATINNQELNYTICADFKTVKADGDYNYSSGTYFSSSSGHKQGHSCFKLSTYAP